MDLFSDIIALFAPVATPPYSAPFIAVVSVLLALVSTWATKRFSDFEQMKNDMEEVKAWQEKVKHARSTMDPILLQEVMDSQSRIMTIQSRMMTARMKPMCVFYIPFLIIFAILNAVYGLNPVAVLPFDVTKVFGFMNGWLGTTEGVTGGFGLYFWGWYFMVSLGIGNLVRRWGGIGAMGA